MGAERELGASHGPTMAAAVATKFSHKLFEPAPMNITETNHCLVIFEKLKIQREQGRFCDVSLKVHGREFPAHRSDIFTLVELAASCSRQF